MNRSLASVATLAVFSVLVIGSGDSAGGGASSGGTSEAAPPAAPAESLSANALFAAYNSNEVAADAKYKGKGVIVSGRIQDIGKDIMDNAYVVVGGQGFLDGVQCTFPSDQQSVVAALQKGQAVVVTGSVTGKMGNVQVEDCAVR